MISERLKLQPVYKEFVRELKQGRLSNAYLFVGEDSLTGEAMLSEAEAAIMCPTYGCGVCKACKAVFANSHPDVHIYNREKKMNVSDAENLVVEAQKGGWQSGIRIFAIYNAEKLTPEVQNKLLKVMEEPPEGAVILMHAAHESALLPTVRSRVKLIRLPLWDTRSVCEELEGRGAPSGIATVASRLAGGSFSLALAYAEEEGLEEDYARVFDMLANCANTRDAAKYVYSDIFTAEKIRRVLDFTEIILRDVLADKAGAGVQRYTYNRDYDLNRIGDGFTAGGAAMAILRVNALRSMLEVNIAPETVGEKMLFDILEAKYKWRQS